MITSTMMFLGLVSVIGAAGAWIVEEGLRRTGLHRARWVWLFALASGPLLLAVGLTARAFAAVRFWGTTTGLPGAVSGQPLILDPLVTGSSLWLGALPGWVDPVLGGIWLGAACLGSVLLIRSAHRLRQEMIAWVPTQALGRPVHLSALHGPAVTGFRTPLIVLPSWALELEANRLELILRHEEEHIRAGDPRTVALGLLLALANAWNPVAWWQWRRLRGATEVDCDARVLASTPDTRRYGETLLEVARRGAPIPPALAAFSERGSALHRRIMTMTISRSARSIATGTLLLVGGVSLTAVACDVPMPLAPAPEEPQALASAPTPDGVPAPEEAPPTVDEYALDESPAPAPPSDAAVSQEPTFTPFTVKPDVRNRAEVGAALEREYPPLLRDAGISGTVNVWMFIDETGRVTQTRIHTSSGHPALDEGAIRVAEAIEFTPALNKDVPVAVWIALPVTFQTR